MVPVVKIGAIAAVVGVSLTGTYFMVFGMDPMPKYELVSTTNSYNSKIGDTYKHFLVDTTKKDKNDKWWEWSYRRWKSDDKKNASNEFKDAGKVEKGFDASNEKALNKVCDAAYKKSETQEVDFSTGTENKHKLAADVLKYCSPLGGYPSTISGKEGYEGTWINSKKEKLVSTKGNDTFWKLKTDWFNAETTKPNDAFFQPFLDTANANKLKTSLKDVCDKAYGAKETENNGASATQDKPKESEIEKYCSFKKT